MGGRAWLQLLIASSRTLLYTNTKGYSQNCKSVLVLHSKYECKFLVAEIGLSEQKKLKNDLIRISSSFTCLCDCHTRKYHPFRFIIVININTSQFVRLFR